MAAIFPEDIFQWIFLNENVWISINISLKFVPRGPINNIPTLVQVMARRRPGLHIQIGWPPEGSPIDTSRPEPRVWSWGVRLRTPHPAWVGLEGAHLWCEQVDQWTQFSSRVRVRVLVQDRGRSPQAGVETHDKCHPNRQSAPYFNEAPIQTTHPGDAPWSFPSPPQPQ